MHNLTKRILISAGEASGGMHAANLVLAVTKIAPNIRFYGMGTDSMQKVGVNTIVNANELSVFGALEIVTKLSKIWRAFRSMKNAIFHDKPDLLILVDYPGFNLRLAKAAKKAGVKVLYFISPKVWAWHQSRVKIIKNCVAMMAVIFPFEVDFYNKWQVPVTFVGNPLLDIVPPKSSLTKINQTFNLEPTCKTIGLFPGSRLSEIKRLLPVMLNAAKILKEHNPNLQFLLSQAPSISATILQPYLQSSSIEIQIVKGQNYNVMHACDAIISASGTATLEIALTETPLVIIYKMSWLEYQIARHLVKIPYVGLCNILANKKIVLELLQNDATAEKIAEEMEKILNNNSYREEMIKNLKNTRKILENDKQEDVAQLVVKCLS